MVVLAAAAFGGSGLPFFYFFLRSVGPPYRPGVTSLSFRSVGPGEDAGPFSTSYVPFFAWAALRQSRSRVVRPAGSYKDGYCRVFKLTAVLDAYGRSRRRRLFVGKHAGAAGACIEHC
jgi:hypothetical protein